MLPFMQYVPLTTALLSSAATAPGCCLRSLLLQHLKSVNFTLLCCCRFVVYWLILFLVHNMAICLFRTIAALARDLADTREPYFLLLPQVLCVLADPVPGAQYGHLPLQNHWCPST